MYLVELDSATFKGLCYLFSHPFGGWGRIVERECGAVFESKSAAQAALDDAIAEVRYQAPESISPRLQDRLAGARIVAV